MRNIETRLLMVFSTTLGRKVSLFVSDPREDLTEEEIKAAMEQIVEKNIFAPRFGEELEAPLEAKVVQTATTGYDLVI
ncbi:MULTISPECIES: DUF2922 domain-containing protein [Paraclostridium]|uniref:DUF2922 domain-containing protein n=1 Tax=Paraclostridium bifermentans TaxID=1490 RepID=A0A5P3XC21_PARBF|nr:MULTISPECIES: DUF2922 domain-containing protein [Paraclostridium]OXX85136.1 hypothetical protein AVM15_00440 [Paraclostridium benzoelyticum]EQK47393.1 hypothetical protein C671_0868 [[Clostridium] bifermentans ATCC 19299] [Paraclostridium bifermentans ATCC 19299]MBS5953532.1 DUF2922 domain-containing protein [Paraclostridium bifermentans]MBU5288294.1 DUF2922 domain-containing protein [Paraclostridium bifermentans]MCE9674404.1 DUF2922 domain-containing protein [Paraclostridium bifermentans]